MNAAAPSPINPVRLLPAELIHRIAAGEVVDRPASVVKELVENSIDAGARAVKVTVADGGLRLIEVEDDGHGMSRADLEVCVQRHATSKISRLEDLDAIFSLGFRGEALSAVASVSRLSIETFRAGEAQAWRLDVAGAQRQELRPGTRAKGTKIGVADLFFNTPARKKFLRRPATEAQDCVEVLQALALAHPGVAFEWHIVDGGGELRAQQWLQPSSFEERFRRLCGVKAESLHILSEPRAEGVDRVEIALMKPPAAARTQKNIHLTVNGRAVSDKRLPFALRDAFAGLIEVGHFPVAHIRLDVEPAAIDVNIHPQKKEIRWPAGFSLAGIVYSLVRPHFSANTRVEAPPAEQPLPSSTTSLAPASAPEIAPFGESRPMASLAPAADPSVPSIPPRIETASRPAALLRSAPEPRPPFRFAELRVIGEAGAAWILCESERGLVLIDQHAAHERLNFERILARSDLLRSRPLLVPILLSLPWKAEGAEHAFREAIESLGFECADPLPGRASEIEIVAVPECDRKIDFSKLIEEILDDLGAGREVGDLRARLETRLAASLACHGSVRRGQRLAVDAIRALLGDLDAIRWGGLCPHGRPVWIELAHGQIEEAFHR